MSCPGCHTRSGMHLAGCPELDLGLGRGRPDPHATIPHDLVRVVRQTIAGFGKDRRRAATDGEGVAVLLTCAAVQALRIGVDPRTLADAFAEIVRRVTDELGEDVPS